MSIDMSQFLDTFYEESFEGLDIMESGLLNLDIGSADVEVVNTIFRAAHSIKGGSATFGLMDVADFTHLMETLLDEMRDGRRDVTEHSVDVLLQSVDVLRELLMAAKESNDINQSQVDELKGKLNEILGSTSAGSNQNGTSDAVSSRVEKQEKIEQDNPEGWLIRFIPHKEIFQTGNDPVRMLKELAGMGEIEVEVELGSLPGFATLDPEECHLSWTIKLHAAVNESQIKEVFEWVEDESDITIEPLVQTTDQVSDTVSEKQASQATSQADGQPKVPTVLESEKKPKKASKATVESASIRVGIDKVDALIDMVGELVITQSMLSQLGKDFDMSRLEKLSDGLAELEQNTRELQESVMRIRMLPINFAFQRFPRMVRDLSQKLNKKIELVMSGEQTELDKTVMEKIGDPLVHLVRNSLDHGLETPDVRLAAGKPETGVVHLNAYHQGGNIVIDISDDGAGLNKKRITDKALERGLITKEEAESLPDEKIHELLFLPGFSTAEVVSDVSGRGVGMDVVKRNIRALGGTINVASEEGKGSTFTIRLPLTLAILDGQLVRIGEQTFIVPLVSIIESLQVKKETINKVAGKAELYRLRDEYIPIARLYEIFNIKPEFEELEKGLVVVVEGEGRRAGIFVDDLLSQQQVVIKSLETNYKKIDGVSGATILGDGTVALIVDVAGLIELTKSNNYLSTGVEGNKVNKDNKAA